MAFSRVQSKSAVGTSNAPAFTFTTPPALGDLLYFSIDVNEGAADVNISDIPAGWEMVEDSNNSLNVRLWSFWKRAGTAEPSTVAVTLDAVRDWAITAVQYHDSQNGVWGLDRHDQSQGPTTPASTGNTSATAQPNEVWIGAVCNSDGSKTFGAPTGGFSLVIDSGISPGSPSTDTTRQALFEKIVSATGVAGTTSVISGGGRPWAGAIATFFAGPPFERMRSRLVATDQRQKRVRRLPKSKLRRPTAERVVPYPANTVAPAISGLLVVGETLALSGGTWTGSPLYYTYQWYRDGHGDLVFAAIPGATANTYMLVDDDDYTNIKAAVTAYNERGYVSADAAARGLVVEPEPEPVMPPTVIGDPQIGGPLSADVGDWLHMGGYPPVTYFTYQWQRSADGGVNWVDVPVGENPYYWPTHADLGALIRFCVVPHNSGLP